MRGAKDFLRDIKRPCEGVIVLYKVQGLQLVIPVIGILHLPLCKEKRVDRAGDGALDFLPVRTQHFPCAA